MTPTKIYTLLHVHFICEPIHTSGIEELEILDLVEKAKSSSGYKTTERGKVYITMLLDVPLPVQKWVHPREK